MLRFRFMNVTQIFLYNLLIPSWVLIIYIHGFSNMSVTWRLYFCLRK